MTYRPLSRKTSRIMTVNIPANFYQSPNFRKLPFSTACKLPILVYGKLKIYDLSGRIIIRGPVYILSHTNKAYLPGFLPKNLDNKPAKLKLITDLIKHSMREYIKRILRHIYHFFRLLWLVNWRATIRLNFRKLPFSTACKLPILVYGKLKI